MSDVYQIPDEPQEQATASTEPLYEVFSGSRIPVSKQVGPMWKRKLDAALKAYEVIHSVWDQAFRYYNNTQDKTLETPRGIFRRGDSTENVVYSNVNIMLPATYSKDPDITCSTIDAEDEPFCKALENVINTLMRRRDKLNAKHKLRRAIGFGLLTNQGVVELTWTKKDDSREAAMAEFENLTAQLSKAKTQEEVDALYGKLQALEQGVELFEPNGPGMRNVLPHKLIVDPYAEDPDGTDGLWMIREIFYNTHMLNARYTQKKKGKDGRVLKYAPTHSAVFTEGTGERDDGLGLVMRELDRTVSVEGHTDEERLAYIQTYYTQCYLVWDKTTRRVMLFHKDDWKWPIWVWDDPYKLSRFYPYFIFSFGFSTGGTTSTGEVSYYLDQQDEINDINRQVSRIRRTVFNYFFYNAEHVTKDEAEKFTDAIRGEAANGAHILGVRVPENRKISEIFEALMPPSIQAEPFFDKAPLFAAIDRVTNTNDAIRGTQFKTNTTEDAVQTYQEAARMAIGAKVDIIEDVTADFAYALAELCVQNLTQQDVANLIGTRLAEGWREMSLEEFRATYNLTLVAGSMEKPNSVYKKREAVQIAQAVGQFAQAAPGASLKVMLRVLEKAFTEVVILPEDWKSIEQEIQATMTKGVSTPGQAAEQGNPQGDLVQQALSLPEPIKQKIVQMHQQGVPIAEIQQFIQQQRGQNA